MEQTLIASAFDATEKTKSFESIEHQIDEFVGPQEPLSLRRMDDQMFTNQYCISRAD
jgi:hypothetical protein